MITVVCDQCGTPVHWNKNSEQWEHEHDLGDLFCELPLEPREIGEGEYE